MTEHAAPESYLPLPSHLFEILLSLVSEPMHGYRLIADVRERTSGVLELSTSTLYGSIQRLVRNGLVTEDRAAPERSGGPPRQYYRLTPLGLDVVRLEAGRLEASARVARRLLDDAAASGDGR